ncbi:MAG: PaaI family thioesterase [Verrucomicrobiia bacterium]|jgi:acyl-coenzyme A thioesterase PaaI-like protein
MNILSLPFNAHTGLQPGPDGYLLHLPFADHLLNHVGTVHASAICALAEASSGEFLVRHLDDEKRDAVGRKTTAKYSAPADSSLISEPLPIRRKSRRHWFRYGSADGHC